jgi:hypothetical protein
MNARIRDDALTPLCMHRIRYAFHSLGNSVTFVGLTASCPVSVVRIRTSYTQHGSSPVTYDPGVIKPPKLSSLLEDPAFRRYMKTRPALPANLSSGTPWAVFVRKDNGRWLSGQFAAYEDAWSATIKYMRRADVDDVSLVSRRRLFTPPTRTEEYRVRVRKGSATRVETRTRVVPLLRHLIIYPFEWCVRCRRPSSFELFERHHALPRNIPVDDAALRCVFCGMRLHV